MRTVIMIGVVMGLRLVIAGCGGMNRAVGVLPATLDDLARLRNGHRLAASVRL